MSKPVAVLLSVAEVGSIIEALRPVARETHGWKDRTPTLAAIDARALIGRLEPLVGPRSAA